MEISPSHATSLPFSAITFITKTRVLPNACGFMIYSIDNFKMCREFIILINSDVFNNLPTLLIPNEESSLETSKFSLVPIRDCLVSSLPSRLAQTVRDYTTVLSLAIVKVIKYSG